MHQRSTVWISVCLLLGLSGLSGCGPSGDTSDDDDTTSDAQIGDDADGDGISDSDEGRAASVDTDDDGTPDYLDTDSDDDGIPDYGEAGDDQPSTPPVDSDDDDLPDFRDIDSDDNGRGDAIDGTDDLDGDGRKDFQDQDDDDDQLDDRMELGDLPDEPSDTDGDGTPDFQDTDSDDDGLPDLLEGNDDFDGDGPGNYRDTDSDGDCLLDSFEAAALPPVDTDEDGRPDYLDRDRDNDGLADGVEDANCDGVVDPGESSPSDSDTDDDGVTDLVEETAGTDPSDAADNPQANGDFVFVVPYQDPPTPENDDLDFSTNLKMVDVYVMIDRSGSMSTEILSVRNNIDSQLLALTCPPLGSGLPDECIPDIWSGAGTFAYEDNAPYTHHLDLQSNPALTGPSIATGEPSTITYNEAHLMAVWSALTGLGSQSTGCGSSAVYPARATCAGSPAGATGIGYPCFRPNALPVILLATDEAPTVTFNCPTIPSVAAAANNIGAKIIGILGSSGGAQVGVDLNALATQTGAVDSTNNDAPLVFEGANDDAADAIGNGIRSLAANVTLDVSATPVDDSSTDTVDAVASFVHHLETLQLGTAECADGLTAQDTNSDGFQDLYRDVLPGTPVCWRLVPKTNHTIAATPEPQLFHATIEVYGDDITLLDTRDVFFLVPPEPIDVPIE
jgi:hypothetical protein